MGTHVCTFLVTTGDQIIDIMILLSASVAVVALCTVVLSLLHILLFCWGLVPGPLCMPTIVDAAGAIISCKFPVSGTVIILHLVDCMCGSLDASPKFSLACKSKEKCVRCPQAVLSS